MPLELAYDDRVAVLTWADGENRVNLDSLAALHARLDEIEADDTAASIVLTGTGKFFSNGLDLDRFRANPDEFAATLTEFHRTVGRLLVTPLYTVAALNGHAFAAGAMLSLGFDYRVMRADRGYWCMNEAAIGLPLDEKLYSILANRLPRHVAVHAALTAHRYDAGAALASAVVDEAADEGSVLARAIEVARATEPLDRSVMARHKRLLHGAEAEFLGFNAR